MTKKIAITGSLGVGKSTVGKILEDLNYLVIDTDQIVHELLSKKNYVSDKVLSEFGDSIKDEGEKIINRKKLAEIVFSDPEKKVSLETIVHPAVRKIVAETTSLNADKDKIFVLIPLLFESKLENIYDEIWCVKCDEVIQYKRLSERGMSPEESSARIKYQLPQDEKIERSDVVIDNSGSIEETKSQILERLQLI